MINARFGMQEIDLEAESCGRMMWDNKELVSKIWARCHDVIPEILEPKDKPGITRNN